MDTQTDKEELKTKLKDVSKAEEAQKVETNEEKNDVKSEEKKELSSEEKVVKELSEFKEKYFYLAAEMENLRKRSEREKIQTIKFGNENILKDIVSIVDTFELTLNALKLDTDEKMKNVCVGLEMVRKQFVDTLKNHGLEKIETEGKVFDPNFHEAIAQEKSDNHKEMDIIKEQQSGYILNGRVLRASKVTVAN